MRRRCEYCGELINYNRLIEFTSHKGNCKKAPFYDEKKKKISVGVKRMLKAQGIQTKPYVLTCKRCGKEYIVKMTEQKYKVKKSPYHEYCSRSCANSHIQTKKQNNMRRQKQLRKRICVFCGKNYWLNKEYTSRKYCSRECGKLAMKLIIKERKKHKGKKAIYYINCKFKHNIYDYPTEFDLDLIKKYGWFRYNNQRGVSRDHMVSIQYGFENNIPSKFIAHPANCRIITQQKNSKKHTKNFINIQKLEERIREWDKKYNTLYEKGTVPQSG